MTGRSIEDLTPGHAVSPPPICELARIAAALPIAQTDPRHAVRQAFTLWEAAATLLEEKATESDLAALAAAADLAPYIPLEEAMQRTGHKKATGFHQRALTLVPTLSEGWIGEAPDAETFDPAPPASTATSSTPSSKPNAPPPPRGNAATGRRRSESEHQRDSAIVCLGKSSVWPGGNRSGLAAEQHPRDSAIVYWGTPAR